VRSLWPLLLVSATLTLLPGCGESSDGGRDAQPGSAPPGQVDVEGSDVPEEQLASIDEEGPVVEKRTVRRLAFLLDRLEQRCEGRRSRLADFTVNTQQQLDKQKGVERSNREILEDVVEASTAEATGRCIDLFTLYLATTGEP